MDNPRLYPLSLNMQSLMHQYSCRTRVRPDGTAQAYRTPSPIELYKASCGSKDLDAPTPVFWNTVVAEHSDPVTAMLRYLHPAYMHGYKSPLLELWTTAENMYDKGNQARMFNIGILTTPCCRWKTVMKT
jgi:hypothetical protein